MFSIDLISHLTLCSIFLSLISVKILAISRRAHRILELSFFKVPFAPSDLNLARSAFNSNNLSSRSLSFISLRVDNFIRLICYALTRSLFLLLYSDSRIYLLYLWISEFVFVVVFLYFDYFFQHLFFWEYFLALYRYYLLFQ